MNHSSRCCGELKTHTHRHTRVHAQEEKGVGHKLQSIIEGGRVRTCAHPPPPGSTLYGHQYITWLPFEGRLNGCSCSSRTFPPWNIPAASWPRKAPAHHLTSARPVGLHLQNQSVPRRAGPETTQLASRGRGGIVAQHRWPRGQQRRPSADPPHLGSTREHSQSVATDAPTFKLRLWWLCLHSRYWLFHLWNYWCVLLLE